MQLYGLFLSLYECHGVAHVRTLCCPMQLSSAPMWPLVPCVLWIYRASARLQSAPPPMTELWWLYKGILTLCPCLILIVYFGECQRIYFPGIDLGYSIDLATCLLAALTFGLNSASTHCLPMPFVCFLDAAFGC